MSNKQKLIMIGNGMAGMRAIEEILEIDSDLYDITVFGAEKTPNYNRILLSSVLAGETTLKDIIINDEDWYKDNNIELHLGKKITEIQRGYKKIIAEDGVEFEYDKLIIATGSNPFIIPIPGVNLKGVVTFRNIGDCDKMIEASKNFKVASVIGGGLLGLEAAKGLLNLGMEVTVIHDQDYLMNMQLDKTASTLLKKELEDQGMKFLLRTLTSEICSDPESDEGRVSGLKFTDGSTLKCDLVAMSVGIRPNIELAQKSHLYTNKGIIVNDYMQTVTDTAIFSVGECIEHRNTTYGLVAPLFEQAKILAYHLTGRGFKTYEGSVTSTKLKVSGVNVFSAGNFHSEEGTDTIEFLDKSKGVYKKIVLKDDVIQGAVMFGNTKEGSRIFQLMTDSSIIDDAQRQSLIFSSANIGDIGHSGINEAAQMTPETIVCGCNGVTKHHIVTAIKEQGLTSRDDIVTCTKAAGSCGGCATIVDDILASVLGSTMEGASLNKPICKCTKLNHEELKDNIRQMTLTSVKEVISVLDWTTEGCHVCRPAINYYLEMTDPHKAVEDRYSRVANERIHGNIQKDGTYSVIPRIYGGLTKGDELIKMGEVANKYNITDVKITGAQRIGLFGVKKEDLLNVWEDLGMPSGFAYGKALRMVKTCVGNKWCRFGTQDAMDLGIKLEKIFGRIWTPAKTKMAVSGCPRNCAEASIKDIGVVGVEGAFEIYIGGNGGVTVRAGDLLCNATTEEEVINIVKAYTQFYRENARHNERTAPWIERVGLQTIKDAVVEDLEKRDALIARIDDYLSTLKEDPWNERIIEKHESEEFDSVRDYTPIDINIKEALN